MPQDRNSAMRRAAGGGGPLSRARGRSEPPRAAPPARAGTRIAGVAATLAPRVRFARGGTWGARLFAATSALAVAAWTVASAGRGPEAQVQASANAVVRATYAVFQETGITISETDFEEDDGEFDIEGMRGDTQVDVSIEREGARFTDVEVNAGGDLFDGLDGDDEDEALARDILNRIVRRVS